MISNLRISVAELVVWALLAAAGLTWVTLRMLDGAAWLVDWLRDRRGDGGHWDDEDSGLCAGCKGFAHCDGADFACNCTCTWPEDWAEPLPPERTWEQMTSHQLPLADQRKLTPAQEEAWQPWVAERERRAPWWEAEARSAYQALDLDYPSGLLARVREAGQ